MKKITFLIISMLILILCACGEGGNEQSAGISSDAGASSETVSQGNYESSSSGDASADSSGGESSEADNSLPESFDGIESSTPDESLPNESNVIPDTTDTESSVYIPDDSSSDISDNTSENTSTSNSPHEPTQVPDESSNSPDEPSQVPDESGNNPDESSQDPDTPINDPNNNESEDDPMPDASTAELLPTGYLIYNGAAYTQAYYSSANAPLYADVYARYTELFPDTRISVINPPLSAINIVNPEVAAMMNDQGKVLDRMEANIYGDVNFINLKETFLAHRGEYLYFKSDYHWTQLGAYYTYCEFAKSIGITPLALSDFETEIVTDSFIGRSNDYANDERILSFYDTVYAYMPTKAHTMTIYNSDGSVRRVYDNCIQTSIKNYSCFIVGDNPLTVINVPENDQSKTVIVIKESSGNAFVPFLTEHYGNIIVIDPRHIEMNICDIVNEYKIDDIVFFAMASTANGSAYCNYYHSLIGE